ncbi:MAG: lamin tail domain-containing protein [Verrucomicrobiota bacterium]|nr:lamin tail domain-containing protein [Verrucomicrobiota bacterium]
MALHHQLTIEFGSRTAARIRRLAKRAVLFATCVVAAWPVFGGVVINEIHYHPASEDVREEFIELHNTSGAAVSLDGWSVRRGVRFDFPKTTVQAGGYLVIAADVDRFAAKHPGVRPVVAGWNGQLSNRGETIRLADADGKTVDSVTYSDEGEWAVRQRGQPHHQHQGWDWLAKHDGGGRSLELINPVLSNRHGQNWAASTAEAGTPGAANSVFRADAPPMVLDVRHSPLVPRSTSRVQVTARLVDEKNAGLTAMLFFRPASAEAFQSMPLLDDGAQGDGLAGDGLFGQTIPAFPDGTVVEFFIRASDVQKNSRNHPAVSVPDSEPRANLLYQVDDAVADDSLPFYRIIMTPTERDYFLKMVRHPTGRFSDARMNATFVSHMSGREQIRYLVDIRNRGNGSRWKSPNNYRVDFPSDAPWHGVEKINLNAQYPHLQLLGSALCQQAGVLIGRSRLVRVRLNGADTAAANYPMYGLYAHNDVVDSDFGDSHDLGPVNIYRTLRTGSMEADFAYLGEEPEPYRQVYFKETNAAEDDWLDLIGLCRLLSETPEEEFVAAVEASVDVDNWLRFFVINTFFDNRETGLGNGIGDDFIQFKDLSSNRHVLVPYDLDTILGRGDTPGSPTAGLFKAAEPANASGHLTQPDQVARFLKHPAFVPRYFAELQRQAETVFSEAQFPAFVKHVLGGRANESEIERLNAFVADRREFILSQIPRVLTLSTSLPLKQGHRVSQTPQITLEGRANAIATRSMMINGAPVNWSAWEATWRADDFELQPGLNQLRVQAFDADHAEVDRLEFTVWHETGAHQLVDALITNDTVLSAAAGPWFFPGNTVIQKQATLSIEAGAMVYFGENTQLEIHGRLVISGEPNRPTTLTVPPGMSHRWRGIRWIDSVQPNRLADVNIASVAADSPAVQADGSRVELSGVAFRDLLGTAIRFSDSALVATDCSFETAATVALPVVSGNGFSGDTPVLFRGNHFAASDRPAPVFVFDGQGQPAAWLELRDNRFSGGAREAVALSDCNSFLWENRFHNFRHPESPAKRSAMVSINGTTDGVWPSALLARNRLGQTDVALRLSGRVSLAAHSNRFSDCAVYVAEFASVPDGGKNEWTNNMFEGCTALFPPGSTGYVTHSLFVETPFRPGNGNIEAPAVPTNGLGQLGGGIGPEGDRLLLSGAPVSPAPNRDTMLTVWGPGLSHYRFRLNGGDFGEPRPIEEPLILTIPAEGQHTLEVLGRDAAGEWMPSPHALSWIVSDEATPLLISEVKAADGDWVEIHNRSRLSVNLSGMSLTDDPDVPAKFVFPDGAELEPGERMVVTGGDRETPDLSLGFSLADDGESVALFDLPARGGRLLDVVVYGPQLLDHSIARLPGGWGLAHPTPGQANRPAPLGTASALRINEWLAKGTSTNNDDFVELFNGSALPVSLREVSLTDRPLRLTSHRLFPALSFIGAGEALAFLTGGGARHLGFQLSADQGLIALFDADGAVVDQIWYAPQTPGVSMGRVPDGAAAIEPLPLPSPGSLNPVKPVINPTPIEVTLVEMAALWRYHQDADSPPADWAKPGFDDAIWTSGRALLAKESSPMPAPVNTPLALGPRTFYFRTRFNWSGGTPPTRLQLWAVVDDGAILHLNGKEMLRMGMPPDAAPHHEMLAGRNIINATLEGPFHLDPALLQPGENTLAAEVHQVSGNSSDIVFGLRLEAETASADGTPGLVINEFLADNRSLSATGGGYPDWVELYNPLVVPVNLSGMGLSDSPDSPHRFVFPDGSVIAGGGYAVFECDPGRPASATNTGFGLKASGDALYLHDTQTRGGALLDGIVFGLQAPDLALGRNPLAHAAWSPGEPTPGAANRPLATGDPAQLRINEWMADPDEDDDWFELFNPTGRPVAVGGFALSDNPANPTLHRLPNHSYIGGGYFAFQKIIADGRAGRGADHVSFKLRGSGESITLRDADDRLVDEVTFTRQSEGVSEGRFPDGASAIARFPSIDTPGAPNRIDANLNGLPDDWENTHGLGVDDAGLDPDGDGLTNLAEYFAGTNPADAASHLALESITVIDGSVLVEFMAHPGIAYRLQARDNLADDNWRTVGRLDPRPSAGIVRLPEFLPTRQHTRYYRIEIREP